MLNPMRDKSEGTYRRREGSAPDTMVFYHKAAEGETFHELSWNLKGDE